MLHSAIKNNLTKVVIKPTLKCFHNCGYCKPRQNYYQYLNENYNCEIPIEKLLSFVHEAYDLGMKNCLISGGDPILYTELSALINEVSSLDGVFVFMNSLGHDIALEKIKELLNAGLGAWNISLDSINPKINDKIRGYKGSAKKIKNVIDNINYIRKNCAKFSNFHLNLMTVISNKNYLEIPQLIEFAILNGISSIYFMYVYGDKKRQNFLLDLNEIRKFRTQVIPQSITLIREKIKSKVVLENAENVLNELFSTKYNLENFSKGIYWDDLKTIRSKCRIPYYYALLEPNGAILPCCLVEISQEGTVGNLYEKSISEIWQGEKYDRFRQDRIDFCLQCPSLLHKTLGLVPEMCRQFE